MGAPHHLLLIVLDHSNEFGEPAKACPIMYFIALVVLQNKVILRWTKEFIVTRHFLITSTDRMKTKN